MAEEQSTAPLSEAVRQAIGPLTKEDALNLIRIMNRATFSGIQEAQVAVVLGHKLKALADG